MTIIIGNDISNFSANATVVFSIKIFSICDRAHLLQIFLFQLCMKIWSNLHMKSFQ